MKKLSRVIIDTNIFVRMLLGSENCGAIYNAFADGIFDIVISEPLFSEIIDVINRPKFKKIIEAKDKNKLIELIKIDAAWFSPEEKISVCRDPKDNIVLECALAAKVDCIVTDDDDLLSLNPYKEIGIISAMEFLKLLNIKPNSL